MRVRRLRLTYEGKDVAAARLGIEQLLSSADLRPAGMPSSAVLLVRRLEDPMPGQVGLARRSNSRTNNAWERAVRSQITEYYQHAERPVLGRAANQAKAVLFADESELLACLARDICQEVTNHRWWWRIILEGEGPRPITSSPSGAINGLVRRMARNGPALPATVARLNAWGQATDLAQRLSETQIDAILSSMMVAFDLPHLGKGFHPMSPYLDSQQRTTPMHGPGGTGPPPWLVGSEMPTTLDRGRRAFLGLALDLQARPNAVRSLGYQRRLNGWWQDENESDSPPLRPQTGEGNHSPSAQRAKPTAGDPAPQALPDERLPGGQSRSAKQGSVSSPAATLLGRDSIEDDTQKARQRRIRVAPTDGESSGERAQNARRTPAKPSNAIESIQKDLAPDRSILKSGRNSPESRAAIVADSPGLLDPGDGGDLPPTIVWEPDSWRKGGDITELGGVLYLINLMISLDLPACFETGWRLQSLVGPWGLLEALARELLDGDLAPFDDPLWAILAHLDGREPGETPGIRLPRGKPHSWPAFHPPESWLRGLPSEEIRVQPLPTAKLRRLPMTYPPLLARWLGYALPFIERRLRLALGLDDAESLSENLLRLSSRLIVSSSHVDLIIPLNDISVPVRLAGLDRNPGWQPDFGRVISLHFE